MPKRAGSQLGLQPVSGDVTANDELIELTDRCARPRCRQEFKQTASRGRRREYCSDTCRGIAEREFKQAKAAAAHYERLLRDAVADVAAFGRNEPAEEAGNSPADVAEAHVAWSRAQAAAQFAAAGDPRLLAILTDLVESMEPLFTGRSTGAR